MHRSTTIFIALLANAALALGRETAGREAEPARAHADRPNVLFIAVDDLRPQLGCYGHRETLSPHIDRLAARGTVFRQAYCNVPVCGPSRLSVLLGLRTAPDQWTAASLETAAPSLPALFKQHGYHAISNGKIFHHLACRADDWSEPPWRSNAGGGERGDGAGGGERGDWAAFRPRGQWQDEASAGQVNPKTNRGPYCEAADVADDAYQDGRLAAKTIADLERLKKQGQPFFLACGFWRPHLPFNAPKRYWDLYDREAIAVADNRFRPEGLPAACSSSNEINTYGATAGRLKTDAFHREARHAYYACVSYVDAQVGKVLDALDALGLADNTVVVLWGDHGWNLGEHEFWGKHNTLLNSLHAPLIVAAPGRPAGNATDRLVEFVDIYPSLCELTRIPVPTHCQGTSFVPLMDEPEREWKTAVYARWIGCEAVKTDRHLFTQWKDKQGRVTARMLFDHRADPAENVNLADRPESAALVEELSRSFAAAGGQPPIWLRFDDPAGEARLEPTGELATGADGSCWSQSPFFLKVPLPAGNYDVTTTLGTAAGDSVTTVRAEGRRLLIEKVATRAGEHQTRTCTVNVRDGTLNLEFIGERPAVQAVEIRPNATAATVYIAGDSTVCDIAEEPFAGWGQMLPAFLKPGVVAVANHAQSGRSAASFTAEKRLDAILKTMRAGDYLLVQFGHNDQKNPKMIPGTTYKAALQVYLDAARERGATPILVTSVQRRRFDADGKVVNTLKEFPEAVRELAREQNVLLVDLHALSTTFYETLGPERSNLAFVKYPAGTFPGQQKAFDDNSHFNEYGGREIAVLVAGAIKAGGTPLAAAVVDDLPEVNTSTPALQPAGPSYPQKPAAPLKQPEGS